MVSGKGRVGIALVVAVSQDGVIGRDNSMPWKLSTDLKRFKAVTLGKPILMGRKTWESIGRPLPGRLNIVISRDPAFHPEGAETASSLELAFERARQHAAASGVDEICVVGGGEIYRLVLPLADRIYMTEVLAELDGDTHFPALDPALWTKTFSEDHPSGEKDSHETRYIIYDRAATSS